MDPRRIAAFLVLSGLCFWAGPSVAAADDDRLVGKRKSIQAGRIPTLVQLPHLRSNGGGRLSPASLDLDTCGCPTKFGDPFCDTKTKWTLDKTTEHDLFVDPDGEAFLFDVEVVEGLTQTLLRGSGFIRVINSGEMPVFLSSVAILLEDVYTGQGQNPNPAPGPSGQTWVPIQTATQNESRDCKGPNERAETCYGPLFKTPGAPRLLLFDPDTNDVIALTGDLIFLPTDDNDADGLRDEDPPLPQNLEDFTGGCAVIDNDGDGQYDEDPPNGIDDDLDGLLDEDGADDDGDGLIDEDDACADAKVLKFNFQFDITGLGLEGPGDGVVPSDDDLRLDLIVTFYAGGQRGGICSVDADCNGVIEEEDMYVRSIQQRLRFDPPACTVQCQEVNLVDNGATSGDDSCVDVAGSTVEQALGATGIQGTTAQFPVSGNLSCVGGACATAVTNKATLSGNQCRGLIKGSPATASFDVECSGALSGLQVGDFCTRTHEGWGVEPAPGNPGTLVHDNFTTLFPAGIVVGDPNGPDLDSLRAILLEAAQSVTDYLPVDSDAEPRPLTADQTDPLVTSSGVLGGRLVAATLNVEFDGAGIGTSGNHAPGSLATLTFVDGCVATGLTGRSVGQVLAYADCAIRGLAVDLQADCGVPVGVTISDLSDALGTLNENFADCDTNQGCLDLPGASGP